MSTHYASGVIDACVTGFLDADACAAFLEAIRRAHHSISSRGIEPKLLVDSKVGGIQGQGIVEQIGQSAGEATAHSRRTAVVVDGALHRLQVGRISHSEAHRVFDNREDAHSWLVASQA
ncbi:MAG TPA: hypothetical protein VJ762_07190 [Sphingobium sp.]|nr:hypothetical protein [Sphingobium sp.]